MGKDKQKNEAFKQAYKEKMKGTAKERKQLLQQKRARLIVRNLPFTASANDLQVHFEKYGKVTSVELLKKEEGQLVGCGFVQFEAVQKAAKAKHHLSGKEFMGRLIECDFSLPKKMFDRKEYQEKRQLFWSNQKIKEEPVDGYEAMKEIEPDESNMYIKSEDDDKDSQENENNLKSTDLTQDSSEDEEKSSNCLKEEETDDKDSDDDNKDEKLTLELSDKKPKYESHDVAEGKTIFIKNLPFEATNDDLKECMNQFGPTYYALVCVDKMTEHSKGTGFVKFRYKTDADRCLKAGTELTCLGTILDCHPAIQQQDMQKKEKVKQTDSRNLYLIKEGVVLAGSKAAEGVSSADMAKRLQLEQFKTQMLRNLNMFISKTRLIVHNLPAPWDDSKLRILIAKHAGPGAIIREARIMRNMKNVDAKGVGASKEYGFVTFTTHDHALNTLRSLNNNPQVFSQNKRPIVGFSIENRVMVNRKQKQMEKSRQLNPLTKQFDAKAKSEHLEYKKKRQAENMKQEKGQSEEKSFTGNKAKPGQVNKMRSKFKLKTQAATHREQLKAEKKKKKNATKPLKQRKEDFIRQARQKVNNKMYDDKFSKMVNAYKTKLIKSNSGRHNTKLQARGGWADG